MNEAAEWRDEEWTRMREEALQPFSDSLPCYLLLVFYVNDPLLLTAEKTHASVGQRLATVPAQATMYYYSLHKKKMIAASINVVGAFYRRQSSECSADAGSSDS